MSLTCSKVTLPLSFLLAFCKIAFHVILRRTIPAKTGAAGPFLLALKHAYSSHVNYKPQAYARVCDENNEENKRTPCNFYTQKGKN